MDATNLRTWRSRSSLRLYRRLEGYQDAGERIVMNALAPAFTGRRVLDLGVGAGRTTAFFAPVAAVYVGVDYTPEMVAACRQRFPNLRFDIADARDLSQFADGSFDFVKFSFNGIDTVDAQGRRAIMSECARVLAPGGVFCFSTFNLDGPGFRGKGGARRIDRTLNPLRLGYSLAKFVVFSAVGMWRRMRRAGLEVRNADHGLLLHKAHDFGIMVYAGRVCDIAPQLAAAGFGPDIRIIGASGRDIVDSSADNEEYVHVVAVRPE